MEVTVPAHHVNLSVPVRDMSGVGEARRTATALASKLHLDESSVGRVGLIVTEAASNLVEHAGGGEVLLRPFAIHTPASIEIVVLDKGPGMANPAECIRDGVSTGGSRGVGLGAIARLAQSFDIFSVPGRGTALLARVGKLDAQSNAQGTLEYGAVCVPKLGQELCGDAWWIERLQDDCAIIVLDAVGHGPLAFDAAEQAFRVLRRSPRESAATLLGVVNRELRKTRGAAAIVAGFEGPTRRLVISGIGNVAATFSSSESTTRLVTEEGTLGQSVGEIREHAYTWPGDALLVIHSDGVELRWDLDAYPGLRLKDPSLIAGVLYRDFAARHDDAVVLVARVRDPTPRQAGPTS